MKRYALLFSVLFVWSASATPTISDLKVTPIEPLGLAIDYKVSGATDGDADGYYLSVSMNANGTTYFARSLFGATKCENGKHRVYWNAAKEGFEIGEANLNVTVAYKRVPLYCVIDLSTRYLGNPCVTYLDNPPSGGFNTTEYKTTKLVLKRVNPGTFIMGEDQSNEAHRVTLTKPFYLGLFEVTQQQWRLREGSNPCSGRFGEGSTNPVACVSYDMIRGSSEGSKWPATNSVDPTSFMGGLRAWTGLDFDLPTEAQWEYACRAGTTTKFSYVDDGDGPYMWWYWTSSIQSPHEVGTTKANPWGFYDMHGNLEELCLDWYGTLAYGMDPQGSSLGSARVARGGSWYDTDERYVTSYCRGSVSPSTTGYYLDKKYYSRVGFRIALSLQ